MGRAMPLRACRECGKEVSSLAPTCPHCGVPSPVPKPERYTGERFYNRVKGFIWFVVIAFAVLYFMSLRV
jgi:rRNA maturation protein Nop10